MSMPAKMPRALRKLPLTSKLARVYQRALKPELQLLEWGRGLYQGRIEILQDECPCLERGSYKDQGGQAGLGQSAQRQHQGGFGAGQRSLYR
eukprot:1140865-Pelagomonas_calceolata.AAC.6